MNISRKEVTIDENDKNPDISKYFVQGQGDLNSKSITKIISSIILT